MIRKGNPVSGGIAIGKVLLYQKSDYVIKESFIKQGEEQEQSAAVLHAVKQADSELAWIVDKMKGQDERAKIFMAHQEILKDEELMEAIQNGIIESHQSAEYAVYDVFEQFITLLKNVKDPMIAARTADLSDVRNRVLRIMKQEPVVSLSDLSEDVIVVAHDLLPSDTATLDRSHVLGIITETGGSNSHSAILARGYQIPAVLGVPDAMHVIENQSVVILDAQTGQIVIDPDAMQLENAKKQRDSYQKKQQELLQYASVSGQTADGVKIDIGINIGSKQISVPDSEYEFVGLFRTEFLYMESSHLPTEEEQYEAYRFVIESAHGKAVTLRTLDIGGDKTLPYMELPKEENPFLGQRALRLCFARPQLLKTQLRAAYRASVSGPLNIMFPMVTSIEDIREAKDIAKQVKQELKNEQKAFDEGVKIGIMIEVPAIALIADQAAKEVDFASIGTNDLTQYICAADRMNPALDPYYQNLSPAMLRILSFIFDQFNAAHKIVSVCGEMAGNPESAVLLTGLGCHKLSMSAARIPKVKKALSQITINRAKELATHCKNQCTEAEIRAYLKTNLND